MFLEERKRLPSLKICDRSKLSSELNKGNKVVMKNSIMDITELNLLKFVTICVITEM